MNRTERSYHINAAFPNTAICDDDVVTKLYTWDGPATWGGSGLSMNSAYGEGGDGVQVVYEDLRAKNL